MVPVDEEADKRVDHHGRDLSQGRDGIPHPLPRRLPRRHGRTPISHRKQEENTRYSNGSVNLCLTQRLQCVNGDKVWRIPRVNTRDTQGGGSLSEHNDYAGGSGEGRDWYVGYEVDDPAEAEQAYERGGGAHDEGEGAGYLAGCVLPRALGLDVGYDISCDQGDRGGCLVRVRRWEAGGSG